MKNLLIGGWSEIRRLWSVWIGIIGAVVLAGLPALDQQWPNVAPNLIAFFPKNGQQWVPIIGALIAVAARIVSQRALIDMIKSAFKKGGSDGTA